MVFTLQFLLVNIKFFVSLVVLHFSITTAVLLSIEETDPKNQKLHSGGNCMFLKNLFGI